MAEIAQTHHEGGRDAPWGLSPTDYLTSIMKPFMVYRPSSLAMKAYLRSPGALLNLTVPMFAGFSFHEITLPPANLLPPNATYTVAPSANLSVLSLFVFVNAETSGSAASRRERSMVDPYCIRHPWK